MLALVLAALSVGLDNFAAAIGIGMRGLNTRVRLQVGATFGVFEGGMPVLGLLIGRSLAGALGGAAHLIGGGLLIATGLYGLGAELVARRRPSHERRPPRREGGCVRLVVVGAALSIDNLVVGFALGAYHVSIVVAAVVIAAISVALSLLGLEFGRRLGVRIGEWSELLAGGILTAVGAAIAWGLL